MCGFVGWVDYMCKFDDEFLVIFVMIDMFVLCGLDVEGIWKYCNVLLGYWWLVVIDFSGGVQLMFYCFFIGQEVIFVYIGEVYNYDVLCEWLCWVGYEFCICSDIEVVLYVYL